MSYTIYSDVSADIDIEFSRENDVRFVPMEYVLGEETRNCSEPEAEEVMHQFYDKLRQKIETHTSQIGPYHYKSVFEPLVKEGKKIIYICLSTGLSNTYQSALMAVEELKEKYEKVSIEVIDSLGATGGMGILIEMACNNRSKGMSFEENAEWLRANAKKINYWFKVEDLMYLMRGGRVSAATAVVGTALNIKPILVINSEGKLDTIDKKRGNKQAYKSMIEKFEASYDSSISNLVYICSADCMEDAKLLKERVLERQPDANVRITMLSPIIGAHTGPDMLSLIHFGKER